MSVGPWQIRDVCGKAAVARLLDHDCVIHVHLTSTRPVSECYFKVPGGTSRDMGEAVDAVEAMAARDSIGVVCEIPRGKKAKLRFAICEYQKHVFGDIRTFYVEGANSTDWQPGKGVTMPLAVFGQLAEALRLAEDQLDAT